MYYNNAIENIFYNGKVLSEGAALWGLLATPGELPIVAHKTSRKEWLVTMRAGDWFDFYKA